MIDNVMQLTQKYANKWRDEPEVLWFVYLSAEVGELAEALIGKHEHSADWELAQIAAICLNWLEMRASARNASDKSPGCGAASCSSDRI